MSKYNRSDKDRGISPIMATLFLVIITVAVSGLFYTEILPMFQTRNVSIKAQSVTVTRLGDESYQISATVKNTGDVTIQNVTAEILEFEDADDTPDKSDSWTLGTNNTSTINHEFEPDNVYYVGDEINVKFVAESEEDIFTKVRKVDIR